MEKISDEDKALAMYEDNKDKAEMASLINEHGLMVAEMLQEISGTLPPRPKMPLTTKINHFFNGRKIARQDEMDRMERSIITRQKASVGYEYLHIIPFIHLHYHIYTYVQPRYTCISTIYTP